MTSAKSHRCNKNGTQACYGVAMRCWLLVALLSTQAFAQTAASPSLEDLMHARNVGMGGAYRPLGYGAEAVTGNPAALSMYKRYQLELSGSWDVAQPFGFGTIALADSATTEIAAGIAYHLVTLGSGDTQRTAHLSTVALALPFGQVVHLGLSIRHQLFTGANDNNSLTMNAGLIVKPLEFLTLSVSGHNLIDVRNREVPRFLSFGAAVNFGMLSGCAEGRADFGDPSHVRWAAAGGVEYIAGALVPLRFGYSWDGIRNSQSIGMGIGLFIEGSGVDFGYQHELGGNNGRLLALTLKLQTQ